jgi:hypothetical protein
MTRVTVPLEVVAVAVRHPNVGAGRLFPGAAKLAWFDVR